jgi:hypothetical protein
MSRIEHDVNKRIAVRILELLNNKLTDDVLEFVEGPNDEFYEGIMELLIKDKNILDQISLDVKNLPF